MTAKPKPTVPDLADLIVDAAGDLTRVSDLIANATVRGEMRRARTLLAELTTVHARLQGRLDEYLKRAQQG